MKDTATARMVAHEAGRDYSPQTLELLAFLLAMPHNEPQAILAAIHAAPAYSDSYEARYQAARATLQTTDETRLHDAAAFCAEVGALLAIGKDSDETTPGEEGASDAGNR